MTSLRGILVWFVAGVFWVNSFAINEGEADYPHMSALKIALERKDEIKMKMLVNSLHAPMRERPRGAIQATDVAGVIALAPRLGIPKEDPAFQKFLALYREAPVLSGLRRGYDMAFNRDKFHKAFDEVRAGLSDEETVAFGGTDREGKVLLVTKRRIYFGGSWRPVTVKKYKHSIVFESDGVVAMANRSSTDGTTQISLNGKPINEWPFQTFDGQLLD